MEVGGGAKAGGLQGPGRQVSLPPHGHGMADTAVLGNPQCQEMAGAGLEVLEAVGLKGRCGLFQGGLVDLGLLGLLSCPGEEGLYHLPPTRHFLMRMWGLPLLTGRGDWSPLPQPPPWFMSRSRAIPSMRPRVVKTFPVSTTGRMGSAIRPFLIIKASPAEKVNISMLVVPPCQFRAYIPSSMPSRRSSRLAVSGSMKVLDMRT